MFNPNDPLSSKYNEESAQTDGSLNDSGNSKVPPPAYYYPPDFQNSDPTPQFDNPQNEAGDSYSYQPSLSQQQTQSSGLHWATPGSSSSGDASSRHTSAGVIDSSGDTMSGYSYGSSDVTPSTGTSISMYERRNSSAEHELFRLMKPHQAATSAERARIKRARNTEAARRSRARKTERLMELETHVKQLSGQSQYIAELEERCERLSSRNQELETVVETLQKELNDIRTFTAESSGSEKDERSDDDDDNYKNEFLRHDGMSKGV